MDIQNKKFISYKDFKEKYGQKIKDEVSKNVKEISSKKLQKLLINSKICLILGTIILAVDIPLFAYGLLNVESGTINIKIWFSITVIFLILGVVTYAFGRVNHNEIKTKYRERLSMSTIGFNIMEKWNYHVNDLESDDDNARTLAISLIGTNAIPTNSIFLEITNNLNFIDDRGFKYLLYEFSYKSKTNIKDNKRKKIKRWRTIHACVYSIYFNKPDKEAYNIVIGTRNISNFALKQNINFENKEFNKLFTPYASNALKIRQIYTPLVLENYVNVVSQKDYLIPNLGMIHNQNNIVGWFNSTGNLLSIVMPEFNLKEDNIIKVVSDDLLNDLYTLYLAFNLPIASSYYNNK